MNRNNISKAEINEKNRVLFKNLMNLKEKIKQQIEMNKQENYEAPSDECVFFILYLRHLQ